MSLKQKIESLGARNKSIADEIAALGSVEAEGEAQDVALNTIKELGDEFDANESNLMSSTTRTTKLKSRAFGLLLNEYLPR